MSEEQLQMAAQFAPPAQKSGDPRKLWDMIKDIRVAMLTTVDGSHLHSRPMFSFQDAFEKQLWFFTRASSEKMDEIGEHHEVNVSYADQSKQHFVSVAGTAHYERDPALIRKLWHESLRVWFPEGPDDPDLCLLQVQVESAEYWDSPSRTMMYAYGYAKARLTGRPPTELADNGKVSFQNSPTDAPSWNN